MALDRSSAELTPVVEKNGAYKSGGSRAYSLTHDKFGNTTDNLNAPPDPTTRRYVSGVWRNNNGTTLGRSQNEDGAYTAGKSTGDLAPEVKAYKGKTAATGGAVAKYVAQRKRAGTKGY